MTRAEFIKTYCENSRVPEENRRHWGLERAGRKLYALPCHCGDTQCQGWAMIHEDLITHHLEFNYRPDGDDE